MTRADRDSAASLLALATVAGQDWAGYRKCPTCKAEIGYACRSLSGRIVGGRPDGIAAALTHAHAARVRRRVRYGAQGSTP